MLNQLEKEVVGLIEEGYARWKIAELLGVGETKVRAVISDLCTRFDCRMKDLPDVLRKENNG